MEPKKNYILAMFPYPSGDLHMGHAEAYSIADAMARYARLKGDDVLFPVGWDSFGLPAENAAIARGLSPKDWTYENIETQAASFKRLNISFDWETRLHTSDPEYFRWNQWIFTKMMEKGLAYRKKAPVNWCPKDKTVLANEQVEDGKCERCKTEVQTKDLTQWFLAISNYAQALVEDMEDLQWPSDVLAMQKNWIGQSEGRVISFPLEAGSGAVEVFTTRSETLRGATFLVVAADSPLAEQLASSSGKEAELAGYKKHMPTGGERERLRGGREKTGINLGVAAINPLTGRVIPIYAGDYVVAGYGSGAVMGVPSEDERDAEFAKALGIGSLEIGENPQPYGVKETKYRLRDWLVSRQRYWGTPIPVIHCEDCGAVPVPEEDLPVVQPETGYSLSPEDGKSPLESAEEWVKADCPQCGKEARRDTDTLDTFFDSSWYFLRYPNPSYDKGPFDPAGIKNWLPVGRYIGGKEHAILHLLYARFMTKVLRDMGLVPFKEPFQKLTNQGSVLLGGKAMSKTLGNLVSVGQQMDQYGADAVRVAMLFAGPPEDDIDWNDVSVAGAAKWLNRVSELSAKLQNANFAEGNSIEKTVARLTSEATDAVEGGRLNVAIARLMELTKAVKEGSDAPDGSVKEGMENLSIMISLFAPGAAETCQKRIGVVRPAWPVVDPSLLQEETSTAIVQVEGKIRARLKVSTTITEADLETLALQDEGVRAELRGRKPRRVTVKAPKVVRIDL